LGCACNPAGAIRPSREPAAAYILDLPPSLENQRTEYAVVIDTAILRVNDRFRSWGYSTPPGGYFTHVIVFDNGTQAKVTLAKAFSTDTSNIPESFSGTVSESTLYVVSKELYRPIWEKMYPEWKWSESETYRSLMIHEIAHSEHAYIARTQFGSEDAMGPEWFFEGLAMACANQFPVGPNAQTRMEKEEIVLFLTVTTKPTVPYPFYARVVWSLLNRYSAKILIEHGKDDGFLNLLR